MIWNTALYSFANECMEKSEQNWNAGEQGTSWGYTIPARLAYLCDAVLNIVLLPFAMLKALFGAIYALATWNRQAPVYQNAKHSLQEKTNHFFLSMLGSLFSPALAHKYQNANPAPYLFVARIAVIALGLLYYRFFR